MKRTAQELANRIREYKLEGLTVTRRQFMLEAVERDVDDVFEAHVAGQPGKSGKKLATWYRDSVIFYRDNEYLNQAAADLGLTDAWVDQFFIDAAGR